MRSGKGNMSSYSGTNNQEEEEYDDDEFSSRKDGPSANTTGNNSNTKDGKNSGKTSATRSKHSVTEQRRRSKINERFQILRDLIPHSDQKRDTASFLLEVIEYVQYLQEKVNRYEGSYQGWGQESTKLMPWRNSHWRVQGFAGHSQAVKNGSGPGSTFPGKLDENNITINPNMLTGEQNLVESDPMDRQPEATNKGAPLPMPLQPSMSAPVLNDNVLVHPHHRPVSDAQLSECPISRDTLSQQEELTIEGGTISISSAYSQGLLDSLTEALQSLGVDLSHARISVQIDLGKRANRGQTPGPSISKDHDNIASSTQAMAHLRDASSGEDLDQIQKRLKT